MNTNNTIVVLGPTACGKTRCAIRLAQKYNGEIISADSRQIYKDMNIGTGKDLDEYSIPPPVHYHLIDILDPTEDYSVFSFKKDFIDAYYSIISRKKLPIVCGGTGLYIKAIINDYKMPLVKPDYSLRIDLEKLNKEELKQRLISLKPKMHNHTDLDTKKRIIRAIEIEIANENKSDTVKSPDINFIIIGLSINRKTVMKLITERLRDRFNNGMIDEVKSLITKYNLSYDRLDYFGLEYRFISSYLQGNISYNTMFQSLNSAIHRYAKRQMTFYRYMEKNSINIHWIKHDSENELYKVVENEANDL